MKLTDLEIDSQISAAPENSEEKVDVYLQPSTHFHLPDDKTANLIMVGPGTGIAPFRSFLHEREARFPVSCRNDSSE